MSLSERIKFVRGTLGYSQKEMAKAIKSSLPSVQGYEAGDSVPGGKVIEALVKLGFNANWLLTGEGSLKNEDVGYPLAEGFKMASSAGVKAEGYILTSKTAQEALPSIDDLCILLRDIIETYEQMRPDRDYMRKSREISLIYRHFLEHFAKHHDEVEISEYIEAWL